MVKSKRMGSIKKLAENEETRAGKLLGASQHRLQREQAKLLELKNYREEYRARLSTPDTASVDVRQLSEYRLFLMRLNEAIQQQEAKVNEATQHCEQSREGWHRSRQNTQILGNVVDRYRAEEQQQQQRQEQREQDDRSRPARLSLADQ